MRKTTLHDPAEPSPSPPSPATPSGSGAHAARGRRASRVRNRLLIGVLLTGLAVLAAGAPAVHAATQHLSADDRRLADAERGQRALTLAHTLADERDALVIAAAAPGSSASALTGDARARADRWASALRPDLPAPVRRTLDQLPRARERATSGQAGPADTYAAYTAIIQELDDLFLAAGQTGSGGDSGDHTPEALPDLARAADAAAATRGLLIAALRGEGEQRELAGLAQRESAREAAALADFTTTAAPRASDAYRQTVAGPDVEAAEEYLAQLTARPYVTAEDRELDQQAVHEALNARIGTQRATLASLTADHLQVLRDQRADDVTAVRLRIGLVIAALVLAIGMSVRTARSLTRPLAAVRIGSRRVAADPAGQQPVKYTGRNDEFAEVVASVNALHARALELHQRATESARDTGGLLAERERLLGEQRELSTRLTALHSAVHGMFAHHAQRLLALVGEQLSVIEGLEEHETDPDHLAVLFTLDHLAARMRRHGENLLLLAGAAGPAARAGEPLPLIDVLRAAVSEIERYELVEISPPPAVRVTGPAARDISHLLAELLDNATAFSPEDARVRLTGRWQEGGLMLQVEDEGVGLSDDRLGELNARLADPVTPPPGADEAWGVAGGPGAGIGMGLYTVARLASRHGLRCWLRARPGGGTIAALVMPSALLTETTAAPDVSGVPGPYATPVPAPAPVPTPTPPGGVRVPSPEHARAADDTAPWTAHGGATTESGLPLRTTASPATAAAPPPASPTPAHGVDAEELRRRLGGFQRGARDGHRDAARAPRPGTGEEAPS